MRQETFEELSIGVGPVERRTDEGGMVYSGVDEVALALAFEAYQYQIIR